MGFTALAKIVIGLRNSFWGGVVFMVFLFAKNMG